MRKTLIAVACALTAGFACGMACAAATLDEFVMETIEEASKGLTSSIAQHDGAAAANEAQTLDSLFAQVEEYFVARGDAPDGIEMSRRSRALISTVNQAVAAGDFDAAANGATELARNCKSCHRRYKQDN